MNSPVRLRKLACCVLPVLVVAACGTLPKTSATKSTLNDSARKVVGTSLIGAQGKTPKDQEKIDNTAAGLCGAGTWTQSECARHQKESSHE